MNWGYLIDRWHDQSVITHVLKDNGSPACGCSYFASAGPCNTYSSPKCRRCQKIATAQKRILPRG